LDAIHSDAFSADEPGIFRPLYDALMSNGDYYMHLADLQSYMAADQRMIGTYQARESWTGMAIKNIAASGPFSSDRAIAQYASEIWNVTSCPVPYDSKRLIPGASRASGTSE
jgi:starch phosphorylase